MFAEPTTQHHRPHFHAYYQGLVGVFAIDTIEQIAGDLPRKLRRFVEAIAMHEIHQVDSFEIVGRYRLRAKFGDQSVQEIDFRPVLAGEIYGPLNDMGVFNRVKIDPVAQTLVWPNGADFDPATLHDRPHQGPALADSPSIGRSGRIAACALIRAPGREMRNTRSNP